VHTVFRTGVSVGECALTPGTRLIPVHPWPCPSDAVLYRIAGHRRARSLPDLAPRYHSHTSLASPFPVFVRLVSDTGSGPRGIDDAGMTQSIHPSTNMNGTRFEVEDLVAAAAFVYRLDILPLSLGRS